MTREQINIAIAEACGWKPTTDSGICWDCNGAPIVTPPDYCNDLNAMHNIEEHMPHIQKCEYIKQLVITVNESEWSKWPTVHATARQRAEAFLRTIGKWEEAK